MWQPKRVWSNKKTVWDGKKSVWLQDWVLKTYDGNWENAWSDLQTYWNQWEEVSDDAILDVYDSNTPEPIGTAEDWVRATYTFKDYDGTVLKTGTVEDWWTPVAPTDPTREATVEYTYTFAWWSPAVWPIAKNTVYTATYTATPNVTLTINDALSDTTGTVGGTVTVYFTKTWASGLLYSDEPDILTVASSDDTGWEGYTNSVTLTVNSAGTTTLTITADAGWGVTASDTIEIVCSAPAYTIENKVYWEYDENNDIFNYYLFTDDKTSSNYVLVSTSNNSFGPDNTWTTTAVWVFADSKYTIQDVNWREGSQSIPGVFDSSSRIRLREEMTRMAEYMRDEDDEPIVPTPYSENMTSATWVINSAVFTDLENFFNEPTSTNKSKAHSALSSMNSTKVPKFEWDALNQGE